MKRRAALFYQLTKPGIIRGNAVHVIAGSLFASALPLDWRSIVAVVVGTSFVIASACVVNNYLDRDIDALMKRTSKRPSVTGEVSLVQAGIFSLILATIGFATLLLFTSVTVAVIGAIAYILYVAVYGVAKRATVHSTLVGAIPGGLPAMAGYVAVSGEITLGAWLIFLLITAWQMPHFYAISVFRREEYASAAIPVLAVVKPFLLVKRYILSYMLLYLGIVLALLATQAITAVSAMMLLLGSIVWLAVYHTDSSSPIKWARSVFGASLVLTLLLLLASIVNVLITAYV